VIRKLNYVGIPTRDQDGGVAFWTEIMGFVIATDRSIEKGAGSK